MGKHVWDDETKAAALALLADPEQSYYDVHKATGVPASTLCYWAGQAGIEHSNRLADTKKAREARMERIAAKRAALAEKFLDHTETFSDQAAELAQGLIEVKEGVFLSGGRDAQALMSAAKDALMVFRLEMGESTERTERVTAPSKQVEEKLDELEQRRAKRDSA